MRWPILALMAFVLIFIIASQTTAQNGVRYPESFQITKNGTTVLLEDYASAPRAAPAFAAAAAPPNDFEGLPYQLARVSVLTSEPADVPGAASWFFVVDQNGVLYTLEKRTRQFTPYIDFSKAFPNFANAGPHGGFGTGLFDIVADAYARNGGTGLPRVVLPGLAALTNARTLDSYGVAYAGDRADVRLSVDKDGELYLLSKTDGMIRKLTGVVTPPPSGPR